jgi:ComF family protein
MNKQMVYKIIRSVETLLFPPVCRLCGVALSSGPALCQACRGDLRWLESACRQCGHPLHETAAGGHCGRCQQHPPAYQATTAALQYGPPVDYLIRRLKFSGELGLVPLLADLLAARIRARGAPLPDLLLPVPLHPARLRERGFNQATQLARRLGSRLDIALDYRLCRRHRQTAPQSLLPVGERRRNMRDAFTLAGGVPASHIAIVDDVMTSGHTVGELARLLRRAGAQCIEVWVIARAGGLRD